MPELCSSLIDTTLRTCVSVSNCRSGWTITHSPTTILFLPSRWNTIHLNLKFLKPVLQTLKYHTPPLDAIVWWFFSPVVSFLVFPSVRYLPLLSYFDTILDNLRASFFSLNVLVSQPSKFMFMSSLWIYHDLCWQPAVFVRWTVSCIQFWISKLNLQFLLWSLTLYPVVNYKKIIRQHIVEFCHVVFPRI